MADELGSGVRRLFKYSKSYSGAEPKLIGGDIFKIVIPVTPQVEKGRQEKILEFYTTPKTRDEIQHFIEIKDREYFRQEVLTPLIRQGLLKMTSPDKPNSPKQKYFSASDNQQGVNKYY